MRSKILEAVPKGQRAHVPFITRIKNKSVSDVLDREKYIKSYVDRGDEICAFERLPLPEGSIDQYILCEMKILQARRSYYLMKGNQHIANSRLFIFDKRMTVRDVKLEVFTFLKPLIPSIKGTVQRKKGQSDEEYERAVIEEEYKYYFEGKSSSQ